jgi:hypothetical protein
VCERVCVSVCVCVCVDVRAYACVCLNCMHELLSVQTNINICIICIIFVLLSLAE